MKKFIVLAVLALSFSNAFAGELDDLQLEQIGEGSVIKIDKDIFIPAHKDETISFSVAASGNFAGCSFNMVAKSNKVRKIPGGTSLLISEVSLNTDDTINYHISLSNPWISSISCSKGIAIKKVDDGAPITMANIQRNQESFLMNGSEMSVASFNEGFKGSFTVIPADAESIGVDDAGRENVEENAASTEASNTPAASAE